ncbi:MAG: hypothetical protein ABI337_04860 [Nitrososphaera sp.]|jgi:hypothetical protein
MEYRKVLSRPEARHRYWHIRKAERNFFPETGKIFRLSFDGKTYDMKVNHKDDIMTGQIYERYHFREGDRIIVKRMSDLSYSLDAPDTELYST